MISKKMLSEILNTDIHTIQLIDDNKLKYNFKYIINIYELAHKCKEWALEYGFEINEGSDVSSVYRLSDSNGLNCFSSSTPDKDFDIERVFRNCEWILNGGG